MLGAAVRVAVSDKRSAGQWAPRAARVRALVAPALSPTGGGAHYPLLGRRGGHGGRSGLGGPGLPGDCPASLVLYHPPMPAARDHCRRARPSPAPPLVWGLGLRRLRVPAVAPVGEGGAQGLGEAVVGLRVRDAEHRPPHQERRPHRLPAGPPCPNHGLEDPFVVILGHPPPRGHLPVPPSLRRSTASKGRFLIPLLVPEEAQPSHPYTSITRGRASPPRGSQIASQSRAQSPRAPSSPACRLRLRLLRLRRRRRAMPSRRRGSGHPRRLCPRLWCRGGRAARGAAVRVGIRMIWGLGGLRKHEVPRVGVDVVEVGVVVVVVVGVVRRHLLDAGRDAPHRLDVWLRGPPAPRPSLYALPVPPGPHAPPCLSLGAYIALPPIALGSPPGPQTPCWGALLPLLPSGLCCGSRPLTLASLPALPTPVSFPRPCPCPWLWLRPPTAPSPPCAPRFRPLWRPAHVLASVHVRCCSRPCPSGTLALFCAVYRVSSSAACALACPLCLPTSAAAGLGALPVPLPSLLAACALACPLRSSLDAHPVAFRSSLRAPVAGTLPRPRAVPPTSWITHRASYCRCSCGSVMPGGVRVGAGGQTGRGLPLGKACLGGYGLGGLVWVWLGLVWARYLAPSLPSAAAAAAPGEALGARARPVPCAGGVPEAAAWPTGAGARLARAAVPAPCAPGAPLRAGRQGPRPERRGRPPRPAQAPGLAARGWRGPPGAARPVA